MKGVAVSERFIFTLIDRDYCVREPCQSSRSSLAIGLIKVADSFESVADLPVGFHSLANSRRVCIYLEEDF